MHSTQCISGATATEPKHFHSWESGWFPFVFFSWYFVSAYFFCFVPLLSCVVGTYDSFQFTVTIQQPFVLYFVSFRWLLGSSINQSHSLAAPIQYFRSKHKTHTQHSFFMSLFVFGRTREKETSACVIDYMPFVRERIHLLLITLPSPCTFSLISSTPYVCVCLCASRSIDPNYK